MDNRPWIKIKVRLKWLIAVIKLTKEQAVRSHEAALELPQDHPQRGELHADGDLHWEAFKGFKAAHKEFENDCEQNHDSK